MRALIISSSAISLFLANGCTSDPGDEIDRSMQLLISAGDNQTAAVGTELPQPVSIKAVSASGAAIANLTVNFVVTTPAEVAIAPDAGTDGPTLYQRNSDPFNGKVFAPAGVTDASGVVRTFWTLGTRVGAQTLEARAVTVAGKQSYGTARATALPGPAYSMLRLSSPPVGVDGGASVPAPGATIKGAGPVQILDKYGNAVSGVNVTFAVTAGGGSCMPTSVATGADGKAQTDFKLGPNANSQNDLTVTAAATMLGSPQVFSTIVSCPAGQVSCTFNSGMCIDIQNSNTNCGFCGNVCAAGQTCTTGRCQCPTSTDILCPASPPMMSANVCVNRKTDANNCGSCGNVCPSGSTCVNSSCQCARAGESMCSGPPPLVRSCVNNNTDARNCGGCGNVCPSGSTCSNGSCQCAPGQFACYSTASPSGTCVNQNSDANNCGGCGNVCPSNSTCSNGVCSCANPDLVACGGQCADVRSDPSNCGFCGNVCPGDATCTGGRCVCSQPWEAVCPVGNMNRCINVQSDPSNCGWCGNLCSSDATCSGGQCLCNQTGKSACWIAGRFFCMDVQSDPNNCGGCGNICPSGSTCGGGRCNCPQSGQQACRQGDRLFCIDVQTDRNNCGGCGNTCPSHTACIAGSCQCAPADGGASDAGADAGTPSITSCNNACVDVHNDRSNCGGCGNVCPTDNSCKDGQCVNCTGGSIYCTAARTCVNPLYNSDHCGGCGNACKPGAGCDQGVCACAPPLTDCGAACADLGSDPKHCGACNVACGPGAPSCQSGACAPCPSGTTACAGACVNTQLDNQNCGACGVTCGNNQACIQGSCVSGM